MSSEIPDPIHAAALDRVHSGLPGIDRLIGLGAATTAEVEVTWPSGIRQVLGNVKADQILKVQEEGSVPAAGSVSVPAAGPAPLTERTERH